MTEPPPASDQLTAYDRAHLVTYLQLLDAEAAGADWQVTAKTVLSLDPAADLVSARRIYDSHLARARWMTSVGYRSRQTLAEWRDGEFQRQVPRRMPELGVVPVAGRGEGRHRELAAAF